MTPQSIQLSAKELDAVIERVKYRAFWEKDYETLEAMGETIHVLN